MMVAEGTVPELKRRSIKETQQLGRVGKTVFNVAAIMRMARETLRGENRLQFRGQLDDTL